MHFFISLPIWLSLFSGCRPCRREHVACIGIGPLKGLVRCTLEPCARLFQASPSGLAPMNGQTPRGMQSSTLPSVVQALGSAIIVTLTKLSVSPNDVIAFAFCFCLCQIGLKGQVPLGDSPVVKPLYHFFFKNRAIFWVPRK